MGEREKSEYQAFQDGWNEFERRADRKERMLPLHMSDLDGLHWETPRLLAVIRGWNTAHFFYQRRRTA